MARNKTPAADSGVGSIVRITAGRGKSRLMLVVGTEDGRYLLCGGSRGTENPKKKNPVHVQTVKTCVSADPGKLSDREIAELLGEAERSVS